ncbi:hypothetical protein WN943_013483 [Citrus x changshan-huyou]
MIDTCRLQIGICMACYAWLVGSYPVSCGVDGVKVDVQNGQEMLGATTLIENFQSDHYTAEFYAAARALGGCHVIVRSGAFNCQRGGFWLPIQGAIYEPPQSSGH